MKLLITARDVGAALHLIEIVKYGLQDVELTFDIYVQEPAASYFLNAGIPIEILKPIASCARQDENAAALLKFSKDLIKKRKPDAILSGLSTPFDGGIDEAIVTVAKGLLPTFVLQDYWGALNLHFGEKADYYFCLDERAARLTKERHKVNAINLGSSKHARYIDINALKNREEFYKESNLPSSRRIMAFFGQPLHHLPGYARTIIGWTEAVKEFQCEVIVAYRPHPNENSQDIDCTCRILKQANLEYILLLQKKPESALSLCDVVCSPFSTCSYDACYLNYFSESPLIVPVNLLFDYEIQQYCYHVIHVEDTPYIKNGLAFNLKHKNDLKATLGFALTRVGREQIWQASKQLKNPIDCAKNAINIIKEKTRGFHNILA